MSTLNEQEPTAETPLGGGNTPLNGGSPTPSSGADFASPAPSAGADFVSSDGAAAFQTMLNASLAQLNAHFSN